MRNLVSVVLGGGKGTRLLPLTRYRSKPAVPLAGKYRLIDIPISNCLNSGINRIYLLTQFNSVSLHRHIRQTYNFDQFSGGFVEILAAQQTMEAADWYQGTADAVRKQLRYLEQHGIDYVLILSGDQLYRMDYRTMLETHRASNADVTIAAVPVEREQAGAFGIMQLDETGRVTGFIEKPKTEEALAAARTDPAWLDEHGIRSRGREYLASMGIYLFDRDVLVEMLRQSEDEDFGKQVFPAAIESRHVQVHPFEGYWEDIGTIRAFYEANLALTSPQPPFDFLVPEAPIYSRARYLPPTRMSGAQITDSMIADGCEIGAGTVIENSVIGLRCRIGPNVTIRDSVVMGADYFERPEELAARRDRPAMGIGAGSVIEGAIIDKDCRIGRDVRISIEAADAQRNLGELIDVVDGIVVVEKGATFPDGWTPQSA